MPTTSYSVAVIEDNEDNTLVIGFCLEEIGVSYGTHASGSDFFNAASIDFHKIDLILLDINIPLENGFQILGRLRSDPRFSATKIVALTADPDQETEERAYQAGFDGFLQKPIILDQFPHDVQSILQGDRIWQGSLYQ